MGSPGFYNDNCFRAYPLVAEQYAIMQLSGSSAVTVDADTILPGSSIVDFGCIVGEAAGYDDATDTIYIYSIERQLTAFIFRVRTTCPGLENLELVFTRDVDDGEYVTTQAVASLITGESYTSAQLTCDGDSLWTGYLVTGKLTELAGILYFTNAHLFYSPGLIPIFEPARVQNLAGHIVRGITLANEPRTTIDAPTGCIEAITPLSGIQINAACLAGDLLIRAGYNCIVQQDTLNRTITIGAAVGAGAGEPCAEVPIIANEESPDGGELLTGGPQCNEVLKSINGLTGESLAFVAGTGVYIQQVGDNELTIDFDLHDLQACLLTDVPTDPNDPGPPGPSHSEIHYLSPYTDVSKGAWVRSDASLTDPLSDAVNTYPDTTYWIELAAGENSACVLKMATPAAFTDVVECRFETYIQNAAELPASFAITIIDAGNNLIASATYTSLVDDGEGSFVARNATATLVGEQTNARWQQARVRIYANVPDQTPGSLNDGPLMIGALRCRLTVIVPDA